MTGLLGLWILVKIRLFRGLEYTSDLFMLVELSRSWLQGRPLFTENAFGRPGHAYYLAPLLGFVTVWAGAYGLFAVHATLLVLAAVVLMRALEPAGCPERLARTFALLFGPVGFWIWDNPIYGWHMEALYLPLAVLFAAALHRRQRLALLWAALLVLLREDGAVVACCVQLLHEWSRTHVPRRPLGWLSSTARILAGWLAVFALGLAWQRRTQPFASSRLSLAFASLATTMADARLLRDLIIAVMGALLLFASGLLLASSARRVAAVLAALPILAVALVGTAAYGPSGVADYGPTWPVRFVMLWGLAGAALLPAAEDPGRSPQNPASSRRFVCLTVLGSLVAQFVLLGACRGYSPFSRLAATLPGGRGLLVERLSGSERVFLECLQARLPTKTPIASHGSLFAYFHKHDLIWPVFVQNAWQPPQVVVCESRDRLPYEAGCRSLKKKVLREGFRSVVVEGITVAYSSSVGDAIAACSVMR